MNNTHSRPTGVAREGDTTPHQQANTAEQADPIGPHWYHSPERKEALDTIQRAAHYTANHNPDGHYIELDELTRILNDSLITTTGGQIIEDLNYWSIPTTCTNRYQAATKLNQLLHTLIQEHGPLTYWKKP